MIEGDPLAHWPGRIALRDAQGVVGLVYSPGDSLQAGRHWADGAWRPPRVPTERAAELVIRELPGWALSTDDRQLSDQLLALGANPLRHAHSMSLDLSGDPPLAAVPDYVSVTSLDGQRLTELAADVAAVAYAAHAEDGEGWPSLAEATASMHAAAAGQALGPLLDCSALATRDDKVVGACLVVDRAGDPPAGGPWVLDVFRDPTDPARGVGAAMLSQAARSARAASLPALSLAVTHDNSAARAVYERLGFADLGESWTLALPA